MFINDTDLTSVYDMLQLNRNWSHRRYVYFGIKRVQNQTISVDKQVCLQDHTVSIG